MQSYNQNVEASSPSNLSDEPGCDESWRDQTLASADCIIKSLKGDPMHPSPGFPKALTYLSNAITMLMEERARSGEEQEETEEKLELYGSAYKAIAEQIRGQRGYGEGEKRKASLENEKARLEWEIEVRMQGVKGLSDQVGLVIEQLEKLSGFGVN